MTTEKDRAGGYKLKTLTIAFAIILIVIGSLSWLTPFPGGTPAIALGLAMLICASERAANKILSWRVNHGRLNRTIIWIEDMAPARLGDTLRRTKPSMD